jgi:HD-GYP domain-containing protein (c-di-GMP phosphodiesterase class II)
LSQDWQALIKDSFVLLSLSQDVVIHSNYHHGLRCAYLAEKIAEELIPEEKDILFFSGLLHDIGAPGGAFHLIHFPELKVQIINDAIREHPYQSAHLIRMFPLLFKGQHKIADYVLHHHEWWKGVGYPRQLREEEILLGARILRAADAFDIYSRSGKDRNEITPDNALHILENNGEIDPTIYKILQNLSKSETFLYEYKLIENIFYSHYKKKKIEFLTSELDGNLVCEYIGYVIETKLSASSPGHIYADVLYAVQIAKALGLSDQEVEDIKIATYLHDLGKLAIPSEIIEKPALLTEKEWEIVRAHASLTIELLKSVPSFEKFSFAGYHHERWDGNGYPQGLKGEEIPLGARIICIADALDAMTSKRPYRPTLTFREALIEIEKNSGLQFDPGIVPKVLEIYR